MPTSLKKISTFKILLFFFTVLKMSSYKVYFKHLLDQVLIGIAHYTSIVTLGLSSSEYYIILLIYKIWFCSIKSTYVTLEDD